MQTGSYKSDTTLMIDTTELIERTEGDFDFLKTLVDCFREETPQLLSEIDRCLSSRKMEGLVNTAHSLKGMVGNFCAKEAHKAAESLELAARGNELELACSHAEKLKFILTQLDNELSEILKKLQP